jgi:aryl-alcohol dehydrogenase
LTRVRGRLLDHHRRGRFAFDRLVEFFSFDSINEAMAAGEGGRVVKPVVRM